MLPSSEVDPKIFAKLKKSQKEIDRAHPTPPPTPYPKFFWTLITDMYRTLKS